MMNDQCEREANWFALAFLMPEEDFINKWKIYDGDLLEISYYFGVSCQHTLTRARMLQLTI